MKPIRVLVVEDSSSMRQWLINIINGAEDMEVIETVAHTGFIISKVREYRPDVIIMDIKMSKMNGLSTLKHLMLSYPSRVLIISSLDDSDANITMEALRLGALDFIAKPSSLDDKSNMLANDVLNKIRAAKGVNPANIRFNTGKSAIQKALPQKSSSNQIDYDKIVVIGSSTGGPAALEDILMRLPHNFPYPVIIAQHIPHNFTDSLVDSLNNVSNLSVKKIRQSEYIIPGFVYIAPGGFNLSIKQDDKGIFAKLTSVGEDYGIVSPSVDRLFRSAATIEKDIIACLLTGLGNDGTDGIKEIHKKNGITIAQDQESSLVYSMPEHAIAAGNIQHIMSLGRIPDFLMAKSFSPVDEKN